MRLSKKKESVNYVMTFSYPALMFDEYDVIYELPAKESEI